MTIHRLKVNCEKKPLALSVSSISQKRIEEKLCKSTITGTSRRPFSPCWVRKWLSRRILSLNIFKTFNDNPCRSITCATKRNNKRKPELYLISPSAISCSMTDRMKFYFKFPCITGRRLVYSVFLHILQPTCTY